MNTNRHKNRFDADTAEAQRPLISPSHPSEEHGELQRLLDTLFARADHLKRIDVIVAAETDDLGEELLEVVNLLPAGTYTRAQLADQLNSIITAHGWGFLYGTVE